MKRLKSLLFVVPALLFAGLLCYAVFNALAIYIPQQRERRDFEELKKSVQVSAEATTQVSAQEAGERNAEADGSGNGEDFPGLCRALRERNGDLVGWLKIEDSEIDYPVMKSPEDDPEYYLHRDFDGRDSFSGCLFIGGGCNENSDCFVIYGHNMNNGSMFGALDLYADYDYAMQHNKISFFTPEGKRTYQVFAAFRTKIYTGRDDVFQYYESVGDLEEEEYQQTAESVRLLSIPRLPDAPTYPAQLLFLSTCSYHTQDGRFVIAAYRTEP